MCLFQNLFQPAVKLIKKVRVGSKLKRIYDAPKTPFQRVCESADTDSVKVARLTQHLKSLDPFLLSQAIEQKLDCIYKMAYQLIRTSAKSVAHSLYRRKGGGRVFDSGPGVPAWQSHDRHRGLSYHKLWCCRGEKSFAPTNDRVSLIVS